jgi:hypothetical protein
MFLPAGATMSFWGRKKPELVPGPVAAIMTLAEWSIARHRYGEMISGRFRPVRGVRYIEVEKVER